MSDNVIATLLREMERAFDPLIRAADSEYARNELFEIVGWDAAIVVNGAVETTIVSIGEIVETVVDLADGNLDDFGQLLNAIQSVGELIEAIDTLGDAIDSGAIAALIDPLVVGEMAEDLLAHLVSMYLIRYYPWAYLGSVGLSLLDPQAPPRPALVLPDGQVVRRAVRRRALRFDNLPRLFEDPVGHLKQFHFNGTVNAAGAIYFSDRVLDETAHVLALHGFDASYGFPTVLAAALGLDPQDPFVDRVLSLGYRFPTLELGSGTSAEAALALTTGVVGNDEPGGPAVVVVPAGSVDVTHVIDDWTIGIGLAGGAGGIAIGPNGVAPAPGAGAPSGRLELRLAKGGASATEPAFLIGGDEGTRLELGGVRIEIGVDLDSSGAQFDLLAAIEAAQIVVAAGDGDGFLQHILPPDGFRVPFELGVGFESPNRLYFFGGAGLDIQLPVDIDLFGVIKIPVIGLRAMLVLPEGLPPALRVSVTADVVVDIGPFFATVEGMGLRLEATFPPKGGNLGPVQMDLGFEPPRGIGMRIEAGPVTGGGYLFLDFDNREYAGVLQIKVGPLGLTAVGLVTTRMPDGSDGFSMMLIISADFPPIQLGYGFTLNGAGGMLGVNRTVDVPALQDGVRRGALDSILFPKDAVANARRIITDVGLIFPPAELQFVVGPMIKLGWGSPEPMIACAIGIVIEFPRFTLSILGLIELGLPSTESPVVLLRLGVAGIIDPGRGEVSVDATLFGSFVTVFSISGDIAIRIRWKGETMVAMAAGGFHPRFEPPAGFPVLNRLAIALADSDNPRLRLEAYFAITPAAVMFGARIDVYASVDFGPVGLFEVMAGLGFDVLIRFSPLSLEAEIFGFAALKRNGSNFASVDIELRLTGPTPWRGTGRATVHFMGEHTIRFEVEAGEAAPEPPPPAIDLAAGVRAAVGAPAAWASLPPSDSPVRVRGTEEETSVLLVHPAADLVVRQSMAPLDRDLHKAGNAPISGDRRIRVDAVLVGPDAGAASLVPGGAVTDAFAPAEFFELSDDEKLTAPQFEHLPSGARVSAGAVTWGAGATLSDDVESIVVDADDRQVSVVLVAGFLGAVVVDAVARHEGLVTRGRGVLGVGLRDDGWALASPDEAVAAGLVGTAERFATWIDATQSAAAGSAGGSRGTGGGRAGGRGRRGRVAVPAGEVSG